MTKSATDEPLLARVTRQAAETDGSTDATRIAESPLGSIHLSAGVTNSYLVTTPAGSVVINAGSGQEAERTHRPRYRRIDPDPPVYIITTQSHRDHMGGVPVLAGADTQWIAHETSVEWRADVRRLHAAYLSRRNRVWGGVLDGAVELGNRAGPDHDADILIGDSWAFELGGRRFELYHTPGGETTDSIVVWLPQDRVVFTSNLFGPLIGAIPNLSTLRGDKQRSAKTFITSLERVRALQPELLITGHGDPIPGADEIDRTLLRIRDAVQYILDRTIEGMNAGTDLFTLMREIRLPADLTLPETHGKVSWAVRAIWHEYVGWFRMESTTELYPVPASSVSRDIVEVAGSDALVKRADAHVVGGRPVEALHLSDIVLHVEPSHQGALRNRIAALQQLDARAGGETLNEIVWLRAEVARAEATLRSGESG